MSESQEPVATPDLKVICKRINGRWEIKITDSECPIGMIPRDVGLVSRAIRLQYMAQTRERKLKSRLETAGV